MKQLYLSVFQKAYRWSARQEFDKQPSVFSATLYISALQLFNLLSVYFAVAATGVYGRSIPRGLIPAAAIALLAVNAIFAFFNEPSIRQAPRQNAIGTAYVTITGIAFIVAFVAFTLTGPAIS